MAVEPPKYCICTNLIGSAQENAQHTCGHVNGGHIATVKPTDRAEQWRKAEKVVEDAMDEEDMAYRVLELVIRGTSVPKVDRVVDVNAVVATCELLLRARDVTRSAVAFRDSLKEGVNHG